MSALSMNHTRVRAPIWLSAAALGGIAWNIFGAVQFAGSVTATMDSLVASGLTSEQAAVMTGYPIWMTLAFALGVAGGLAGSVLLLLRNSLAQPVLAASLAAYVGLWIGDAVHGVFAVMGLPQVVVLTVVVGIAGGLFTISRHPAART